MAKEIYRPRDESGADFAFDAEGKLIDWAPAVDAAKDAPIRLRLRLSMLSVRRGIVSSGASVSFSVPKGATEQQVKNACYAATREYMRRVYASAMERAQQEDYDSDDIDDAFDYDADYEDSVTLLSGASIV